MSENGPKVEFALGNQITSQHFFKSAFARSIANNCRDAKSLNLDFLDNDTIDEESEKNSFNDSTNNNFFSLMNFGGNNDNGKSSGPQSSTWQTFNEPHSTNEDIIEMEKLRKQCQTLTEENRRLTESLQANQVPQVQIIDNVLLQTQIDTLQWQLKQTEANRQMYRSLMGQVVRFLERAQKSLDILHEKSNPKGKAGRVPRSRSVQRADQVTTTSKSKRDSVAVDSSSSRSTGGSSRFARTKSVAQIAPPSPSGSTGIRDFTWSVLRRNDPKHCTPPRNTKPPDVGPRDLNKTHEGIVYRRPKQQSQVDPDSVPPEKLSQEAFRLMRTVQSLLGMREPDLALVSSAEEEMSSSPLEHEMSSLQTGNFVNSTVIHDVISYSEGCSLSDRGSTESGAESERISFVKSSSSVRESSTSSSSTLQSLLPGARRSLVVTSFNSKDGSSKTTGEEEDDEEVETRANSRASSASIVSRGRFSPREKCPTSTPNHRAAKKFEKKHQSSHWSRSKPKPATSVSSAEDESGFSSMSSFQEVGLPHPFASPIDPIKGCHTEIGLPDVALDKVPHRRWSSTPAEIRTMFKRHSVHFSNPPANPESISVWV